MATNAFAQLFGGLASPSTTPKKSFIDSFSKSTPTMFGTSAATSPATPSFSIANATNSKLGIGTPQAVAASKSSLATPAAQNYISGMTAPTSPGMSIEEYQKAIANKGQNTQAGVNEPASGGTATNAPTTQTSTTPDPMASYRKTFDDYLTSLSPSKEIGNASKALADVQSDIFGKQLSSRRQYEAALDQSGGTVSGAQSAAALTSRRNNSELADLAVQQNALANNLQALTASQAPAGEIAKARLDYEKFLTQTGLDQSRYDAEQKAKANEPFNLSEGEARYDAQGNVIASRAKTYAPSAYSSTNGEIPNSALGSQAPYTKLTASQKTMADASNNILDSLTNYRGLYADLTDKSGGRLFGGDAAKLASAYNALIFQVAQAVGTGALQQADREVIEKIIPNPTSITGALGSAFTGGQAGGLSKIDSQIQQYKNQLKNYGLTPAGSSPDSGSGKTSSGLGYTIIP